MIILRNKTFSKREYSYDYDPQYSSKDYFNEAKLAFKSTPKYIKDTLTSKKRQRKMIEDGINFVSPPSEEVKKSQLKMMRKAGARCINDSLYYGRKNLEYGLRKKIEEVKNDSHKK